MLRPIRCAAASAFRGPPPLARRMFATRATAKEVATPQEAAELLKNGYQYVDVRTPEEFSAGHVPGAVNIPLGPSLPQGFKDKYPSGEEALVVGCQAGRRSTSALEALAGAYPNAVNYKGGWGAWAAAGMPVEK